MKYWFRFYSESLCKSGKVTKALSPLRTAFAALRYPRSGSTPWARRDGPSIAHRGSPGIHAGRSTPQNLLSASREGRQIKSTAAPRRPTGRPAGLFGGEVCEPRVFRLWERACSRCKRRGISVESRRCHRRQARFHIKCKRNSGLKIPSIHAVMAL